MFFHEERAAGLSVLGCCLICVFLIESVCFNDGENRYFFISRVSSAIINIIFGNGGTFHPGSPFSEHFDKRIPYILFSKMFMGNNTVSNQRVKHLIYMYTFPVVWQ